MNTIFAERDEDSSKARKKAVFSSSESSGSSEEESEGGWGIICETSTWCVIWCLVCQTDLFLLAYFKKNEGSLSVTPFLSVCPFS